MTISDDRWTCPECGRTFTVEGRERTRLEAVRSRHSVQHRQDDRGRRVDVAEEKLGDDHRSW
jgi:transposase-like protein